MKTITLFAGFLLIGATAMAQSESQSLRLCNLPSYADRMKCLEKLATGVTPLLPGAGATLQPGPSPPSMPDPSAAGGTPTASPTPTLVKEWIVSETRSPVDYSPVAIATASSSTGTSALQLSIECRGSRTEMIIRRTPMTRTIEDHTVVYKINNAPPVGV